MLQGFRKFRVRFYDGPRFLGIQPPRRNGYQSPTVTAGLWLYAWGARFLTLPGRIVLLCTGLILFYSLLGLQMPVYLLAFPLLMLFAADLAVGWVGRPRVRVVRHLPRRIAVGASVAVTYRVENLARRPVLGLHVDSLPPPAGVRFEQGTPYLQTLAPRAGASLATRIRGLRRGKYVLPAVRADSSFPFNLWRLGVMCAPPQPLLVYPTFTPLTGLAMPVGRRYQPGGIELTASVADSTEFYGCREYREGDNPRHIHARSSARVGYPVVKELREEYFPRTALILDTQRPRTLMQRLRPERPDPVFEAMISLAAALSDRLGRNDCVVDLFAAGPQVYRFRSGRGLAYVDDILDILACIKPAEREPFAELTPEVVREIAYISTAFLVLFKWDDERRGLFEKLTQAGVNTKAVLVTDGSADAGTPAPETVVRLNAADILAGRCLEL
ncbi:MAG: hypothetical protein BWZ02_01725 [Lentisphaerae bacterium ADurb.BinA184]|nr:MAG: hypothetical protein BWZ02_01725 [Lentisphaerae bacterium ADurb.BinA184]